MPVVSRSARSYLNKGMSIKSSMAMFGVIIAILSALIVFPDVSFKSLISGDSSAVVEVADQADDYQHEYVPSYEEEKNDKSETPSENVDSTRLGQMKKQTKSKQARADGSRLRYLQSIKGVSGMQSFAEARIIDGVERLQYGEFILKSAHSGLGEQGIF